MMIEYVCGDFSETPGGWECAHEYAGRLGTLSQHLRWAIIEARLLRSVPLASTVASWVEAVNAHDDMFRRERDPQINAPVEEVS